MCVFVCVGVQGSRRQMETIDCVWFPACPFSARKTSLSSSALQHPQVTKQQEEAKQGYKKRTVCKGVRPVFPGAGQQVLPSAR